MNTARFRAATAEDADFLAEGVRIAERIPATDDLTVYEAVFGFTREELDRFLASTLGEEGGDYPLTFGTFFVLEREGIPVACCAGWVEAVHGLPSGHLTAMQISRFLGTKRWRERAQFIRALAASAPARSPMALQLESFYTAPQFRGRGSTRRLIEGVLGVLAAGEGSPRTAEISLLVENRPAAGAYAKAGFEPVWTTPLVDGLFREVTGSRGFLQLRRLLG